MINICTKCGFDSLIISGSYGGHRRHTTDDGRFTTDDRRRTTPGVWHKLPTGELTRYNYTEDGYRKRLREATPETEETPDQLVIRLKNYLAKWLEPSGSSPQNFHALVDLIVKEQFINACSEDLAMYLLEREDLRT